MALSGYVEGMPVKPSAAVAALAQIGQWALAESSCEALLQRVAERVAETLNAGLTCITRLDPSSHDLRAEASTGWPRDGGLPRPVEEAASECLRTLDTSASATGSERLQGLTTPLWERTEPWGALCVHRRSTDPPFLSDDVHFLQAVGAILSEALGHFAEASERRDLSTQLRQAQKMETLGRLAGGIAHDFNNLLMIILGQSELLALALAGEKDELQEQLAEIRWASERAGKLTQQLLAFSRKEELRAEALDLNQVILEMGNLLGRLLGEHIQLRTVLDSSTALVRADRSQLEQVLVNLALNARDAMPTGGRLGLTTQNVDLPETFILKHGLDSRFPGEPGPYTELRVSDTGCGIPEEHLQQIFEPFFTTKERDHGTGLGLATVYGIVRRHAGLMTVTSEIGRGTTFSLYLPRISEPRRMTPAEESPAKGQETILLVEDEEQVRKVLRRMLEHLGYTVLEASDHRSAIEWAERHPERVDLLITDVVMPGMHGPELAAELLRVRPGLKVLYISGYTDDELTAHGADEVRVLRKPLRVHALSQTVRRMLDTKRSSCPPG